MLATLQIPHLNGIVVPATGQSPAIGTYSERLDRTLMPLPKRQALPALRVPPAQVPIAAAPDQHPYPLLIARTGQKLPIRTPRYTIEEGVDVVRVPQNLPSFSRGRVPQPGGIV